MFQATRRRLALWYTLVIAMLLLVFATGVYLYGRNTLIDRTDDTLKHLVEVVERSLIIQSLPQGGQQVNLEASFRQNDEAVEAVEEDHIDLEWFSSTGQLLRSSFPEPSNIPLRVHPIRQTVQISPSRWLRQMTKAIVRERQILGYLRVSHPWFEVTKPTHQLLLDLALITPLTVISVGVIGWLLAGLAMEPIGESYQSLKQFTADASHELRNPIATIQTNVQMLLNYDSDPQFQKQQLQTIERLTQRLGRLVNDLLFLARSDSGIVETDWQSIPLDALLIEAIEEHRTLAEKHGIYLSLRIPEPNSKDENIFNILGDWDSLARLFGNLISNAIEYTQLKTENSQTAAIEVELKRLKKDRHWLQIKVQDTGTGIPESALPHLFDRFYRVDPSRHRTTGSGAGLGLAIVAAIVKRHRGQISVESTLGEGTTFTVLLPTQTVDVCHS